MTAHAELNVTNRTWTNDSRVRDESSRIRPHVVLHEIEDTLSRLDELIREWGTRRGVNGQDAVGASGCE